MLPRVLETEAMDTPAEAADYDSMDHDEVNRKFVAALLSAGRDWTATDWAAAELLDVGTGTAQIPIELCRQHPGVRVLAIDLAEHMLAIGRRSVQAAGFESRIELARVDAKRLPYESAHFAGVISNSIVHHIPDPLPVLAESLRVVRPGGLLFFRDLLRPADDATVRQLVNTYAAGANVHQRQMFDDSLRAALTLKEVRAMVGTLGFSPETVQATSDRHWTWIARKPSAADLR